MKEIKINNKAHILILMILMQSISTILITNQAIVPSIGDISKIYNYPNILGLIIDVLGISVVIWAFYIVKLVDKERESDRKLNHSTEAIQALRGQKHDFHNHLNVIAGLIQLEKGTKALDYIHRVSGNTVKMFSISTVENPEIAAILYRKCAIAENNGITVDLGISSALENIDIDSVDICTILFNLIDNAIYELEQSCEYEKILTIDIAEQQEEYIFSIGNSYPILPSAFYDKVFKQGFSTKEGNGHGYGLSIVKKIVQRNKGRITVESYEGIGTLFTVFLPKK